MNNTKHAHAIHKAHQCDPHRIWAIFCSAFIIVLIALLGYFSWYFIATTERLDNPAAGTFETNADKIKNMDRTLGQVETVVKTRMGK